MTVPGFLCVARLDLAEIRRSRWVWFTGAMYASIGAVFILVGLHESSVVGFTGTGRVLVSLAHVLLLALPLLALTATGQLVSRARDDGTLELLLSNPVSRGSYLGAIAAVRYLVLLLPLIGLMLVVSALGSLIGGARVPWSELLRAVALSATLLWAFVGVGLAISTSVRDQTRSMVGILVAWALAVALLDLGLLALMLRWQVNARTVFLLAGLNPVQCARMALLSGADPELGVLGPVGFYLTQRIGPAGLLALGLAWPTVVGFVGFGVAMRRFCRADLL